MGRRVAGLTGEPNSAQPEAGADRANDARHRQHLMALARQLTWSATLKCKGSRGIGSWWLLVARVTLHLSRRDLIEAKSSWSRGRDCNLDRGRRGEC